MGEHLLCKQGVVGSNPVTSTKAIPIKYRGALVRVMGRFVAKGKLFGIAFVHRKDERRGAVF